MRASGGLALAVVALVTLGGCSLIFPFDPPGPGADAGQDAPAPKADADAGPGALESGADPDLTAPADSEPQAFPCHDDAGCVACEPVVNKNCLGCTGGDCNDGLPTARDPWPQSCNQLLFEDEFIDCCPRWQRIHNNQTIYEKPCGVATFDVDAHSTQWMRLTPSEAMALPHDYLLEVRFFPPTATGDWWLYVTANSSDLSLNTGRTCMLEYSAATGKAELAAQINGTRQQTTVNVTVTNGGVLQSWYADDKLYCRVNNVGMTSAKLGGNIPKGGTVDISVYSPLGHPSLYFYLDYVRIFAPGTSP